MACRRDAFAARRIHAQRELRLIGRRREFLPDLRQDKEAHDQQRHRACHDTLAFMLQDVVQHAAIPCFQRRERGLEPLPRLFQKRWHRRFSDGQVQRRHHRRQRKRHEERQQHGERDCQTKFFEILAVDARHHADGQKDRRNRKRRRHDGQHDFFRAVERRRFRVLPHLAMADDVLDDDDGIVDEQADRERQAEEAHRVDAEMAEVHERA